MADNTAQCEDTLIDENAEQSKQKCDIKEVAQDEESSSSETRRSPPRDDPAPDAVKSETKMTEDGKESETPVSKDVAKVLPDDNESETGCSDNEEDIKAMVTLDQCQESDNGSDDNDDKSALKSPIDDSVVDTEERARDDGDVSKASSMEVDNDSENDGEKDEGKVAKVSSPSREETSRIDTPSPSGSKNDEEEKEESDVSSRVSPPIGSKATVSDIEEDLKVNDEVGEGSSAEKKEDDSVIEEEKEKTEVDPEVDDNSCSDETVIKKVDDENEAKKDEEAGEKEKDITPIIVSVCAVVDSEDDEVLGTTEKVEREQSDDDKATEASDANKDEEVTITGDKDNSEKEASGDDNKGKSQQETKDGEKSGTTGMSQLTILDVRTVSDDTEANEGESLADGDKKKNKQSTDETEMKNYATDTMNELLGLFGYEKVDDNTKDSLLLSNNLSGTSKSANKGDSATDDGKKDSSVKKELEVKSSDKNKKEETSSEQNKESSDKTTKSGEKSDEKVVETNSEKSAGSGLKKNQGRECSVCEKTKTCKYQVLMLGTTKFLCDDECFRQFRTKQNIMTAPAIKDIISDRPITRSLTHPKDFCNLCHKEIKNGMGLLPGVGENKPLCSESCMKAYQAAQGLKRACSQCGNHILSRSKCLTWEAMEFCNEECLGKYQSYLGSHCAYCNNAVQQTSLGKYCVRFGSDIKQFCSNSCLEEFKKGLKVCSYCQKDISSGTEGFLAPVGDKGQFKEFCSQSCMEKYETMGSVTPSQPTIEQCSVCNKLTSVKVEVMFENKVHKLCSEPCIAAFRYANKINTSICDTCNKFFDLDVSRQLTIQFEGTSKRFCSKACMNVFVLHHRKVVPCSWCKVKKYNFDMIERVDSNNHVQLFCSLNCLSLFRVSLNATSSRRIQCDFCHQVKPAQYHLTMSDASIRNFCSYNCVMQFQSQFTTTTPIATPPPAAVRPATAGQATSTPIISSVMSLAPTTTPTTTQSTSMTVSKAVIVRQQPAPSVVAVPKVVSTKTCYTQTTVPTITQHVVVKQPLAKPMKNKTLMCKPSVQTKGVSCKPHPCHKTTQTDETPQKPIFIPVPVPIYVPIPMHMYTTPIPIPLAFPLPIPVPIFIPTTKNSASSIFKQIKEIQQKIPDNPFEADLILMAEMVAEDNGIKEKKIKAVTNKSSSEDISNVDSTNIVPEEQESGNGGGGGFSVEPSVPEDACQPSNTFGDEVLQMAINMASTMDDSVDLETALNSDPALSSHSQDLNANAEENGSYLSHRETRGSNRNHKRAYSRSRGRGRKRARIDASIDNSMESQTPPAPVVTQFDFSPQTGQQEYNSVLKYSYGVNAWKHWVLQKNTQLEKASQTNRKLKLFKTDLLQLTADELNYSLCLFVKEVRKPNGEEYAPDSIYYLCLGIQQYVFENGRIDNIFSDAYYEKFTECLNEVLQRYEVTISSDGIYLSRIEEEILWECKQLGAHSPHVLLNTLMYFNTKYFMLKTVEDHMQLSFTHILKHWKKSGSSGKGSGGGRNVLLRYYPPSHMKDSPRRRKESIPSFEQVENLDNPLRCPVKLYEFYLSKCPESIKSRNDVFYLYPERSCVPDSPVWYSTMALGKETIAKMLTRIRFVREVGESMVPVT